MALKTFNITKTKWKTKVTMFYDVGEDNQKGKKRNDDTKDEPDA